MPLYSDFLQWGGKMVALGECWPMRCPGGEGNVKNEEQLVGLASGAVASGAVA